MCPNEVTFGIPVIRTPRHKSDNNNLWCLFLRNVDKKRDILIQDRHICMREVGLGLYNDWTVVYYI